MALCVFEKFSALTTLHTTSLPIIYMPIFYLCCLNSLLYFISTPTIFFFHVHTRASHSIFKPLCISFNVAIFVNCLFYMLKYLILTSTFLKLWFFFFLIFYVFNHFFILGIEIRASCTFDKSSAPTPYIRTVLCFYF